jgi:hypothetical protein
LECGFLGVIGTEFVAEKRSSCAAPTLDAIANNSKGLTAVSAFRCAIFDFANVNTHSCPRSWVTSMRRATRQIVRSVTENAKIVPLLSIPGVCLLLFFRSPAVLPESSSTTRSRSPK